jgi:hypothetical protein
MLPTIALIAMIAHLKTPMIVRLLILVVWLVVVGALAVAVVMLPTIAMIVYLKTPMIVRLLILVV